MRGLKLVCLLLPLILSVASFTDAWIETETWSRTANLDAVASFTDAWIETATKQGDLPELRRIFYRCVD